MDRKGCALVTLSVTGKTATGNYATKRDAKNRGSVENSITKGYYCNYSEIAKDEDRRRKKNDGLGT